MSVTPTPSPQLLELPPPPPSRSELVRMKHSPFTTPGASKHLETGCAGSGSGSRLGDVLSAPICVGLMPASSFPFRGGD